MPPTRRPADDIPDDLRLQSDEPDEPPLFREEGRAAKPPAKARPVRDPLDVPLDEPLDAPVDDFVPIEPDDEPYTFAAPEPPRPKGPQLAPESATPAKSSPSSPRAPRRERPAPRPAGSKKWLLPAGIALLVFCVVAPAILVLATGTESKTASPLPVYPPTGPGSYTAEAQSPTVVSGTFGKAFTPGKEPEAAAGEPIEAGATPVQSMPGMPMPGMQPFPGANFPNRPVVLPPVVPKVPNIEDFMPKQAPPPQFVPVPVPPMVLGKPKIEARQGRPVLARVGQRFAYKVPLSAMPNYPLTFTISEGPKGASISDSGLLTWEEPAGEDGAEIAVVVRITNRPQGVDLTDAFKIRVRNPAKP